LLEAEFGDLFQWFRSNTNANSNCLSKGNYMSHYGRGVMRLDGARGKKQGGLPHVWTWGLFGANVLFWR